MQKQALYSQRIPASALRRPRTRAMAAAAEVPLVTLGKHREIGQKIAQALAPRYNVMAITPSVADLSVLLPALRPTPKGLLIGGGYTDEEAREAQAISEPLGVGTIVRVTPGTVEKVGPAGVADWIKSELDAKSWD